jgi:hypothetical protein
MPNWANSTVIIEGEKKALTELYNRMEALARRKEPLVPNGFGTTWLGCLVADLGADWQEVGCRGDWYELEYDEEGNFMRFESETAWGPTEDVFRLIQQKYPTLKVYYSCEEPGNEVYCSNDVEGKYFPYRYVVEASGKNVDCTTEDFITEAEAYKYISKLAGRTISTPEEVEAFSEELEEKDEDAYCYLHEIDVTEL